MLLGILGFNVFIGYHRFDNLYQLSNSMVIPKRSMIKDNSLIPSSKLKRMRS